MIRLLMRTQQTHTILHARVILLLYRVVSFVFFNVITQITKFDIHIASSMKVCFKKKR